MKMTDTGMRMLFDMDRRGGPFSKPPEKRRDYMKILEFLKLSTINLSMRILKRHQKTIRKHQKK